MRLYILIILCLGSGLALSGCNRSDRYELTKNTNGQYIRLDKKTGEVALISGEKISILKDDKVIENERKQLVTLETPIEWDSQTIAPLNNITASLKTIWRDGNLCYQLRITPFSKTENSKKRRISSFLVSFSDESEFEITTSEVLLSQFTASLDENGEEREISCNKSVPLSHENYKKVSSWDLRWTTER